MVLFISESTVKTHVRRILDKLEAANRTEAVARAAHCSGDSEHRRCGLAVERIGVRDWPGRRAVRPVCAEGPELELFQSGARYTEIKKYNLM